MLLQVRCAVYNIYTPILYSYVLDHFIAHQISPFLTLCIGGTKKNITGLCSHSDLEPPSPPPYAGGLVGPPFTLNLYAGGLVPPKGILNTDIHIIIQMSPV